MLGIVPLLFCIILQTPEGGLNLVVNPGGGNTEAMLIMDFKGEHCKYEPLKFI